MASTSVSKDGGIKISKRVGKELHQTKVVVRRLPPDVTEEKLFGFFLDIPPYSHFYLASGDSSLGDSATSRAYFSFVDEASITPFKDKYDGLLLESAKGYKYRAVIEFSPYQGIPKIIKKKPDARIATIQQDADYLGFSESLEIKKEPPTMAELSAYVDSLAASKTTSVQKTPLIEYIVESQRRMTSRHKKAQVVLDSKKKRTKDSAKGTTARGSEAKESQSSRTKKEPREKSRKKSLENNSNSAVSLSSSSSDKWSDSSSSRKDKTNGGSGRSEERGGRSEERGGGGWRGDERSGRWRNEERRQWRNEDRSAHGRDEDRSGGNPYKERKGRSDGERKSKDLRTKNKDRPDQAIYSPRDTKLHVDSSSSLPSEARKGAREKEDGPVRGKSGGWKKKDQMNSDKPQGRDHGDWDEYTGPKGSGRGGGGRSGRNRESQYDSRSYDDK